MGKSSLLLNLCRSLPDSLGNRLELEKDERIYRLLRSIPTGLAAMVQVWRAHSGRRLAGEYQHAPLARRRILRCKARLAQLVTPSMWSGASHAHSRFRQRSRESAMRLIRERK